MPISTPTSYAEAGVDVDVDVEVEVEVEMGVDGIENEEGIPWRGIGTDWAN